MSAFYPAVMAQVDFACSVLGFIKRLLRAVLPALARDRSILGTQEQFKAQIDAAFVAIAPHEATEIAYRLAVANAACGEVAKLCGLLTDACECVGLEDIAKRYLDPKRFMRLVLKQDAATIDALFAVVKSGDGNIGRLLMRIGAILDGRSDTYDALDAAAKRKATVDTKKIIAEVKSLAKKIDEGNAEIVEHLDAVSAKVDKTRQRDRRGRRARYGAEAQEACVACWRMAQENTALMCSMSTRVTFKAAYTYYAKQLARYGIDSVEKFRTVVHSCQSRDCEARKRKLNRQERAIR